MSVTEAGVKDLTALECGTAWLVLLTLDHPDLDQPIRVTSDGVATISNGLLYDPFPFEIILPDDVEGRAPRATFRQHLARNHRGAARPGNAAIDFHPNRPLDHPRCRRAQLVRSRMAGVEL